MTLREQILRNAGLLLEDEGEQRAAESTSYNYLDNLKKLINAEAAAAIQYKIAADAIVGPNQSYLVEHFNEHAKEEWGHYTQLVQALMERGGHPDLTMAKIISDASPATKELSSFSSDDLKQFFIEAEDGAIKAYQAYYDEIKDGADTKDLADIINGIISDEREHKLDFERIKEEE